MVCYCCLIGCGSDNDESPTAEPGVELNHAFNLSGTGGLEKQVKVIESMDDYQNELLNYSTDQTYDIDFSKNKLLLVDLGFRGIGYSISLDNSQLLEEDDDSITVTVILTIPGTDCVTTQAFTTPYVFYLIPTEKEVLIREELEHFDLLWIEYFFRRNNSPSLDWHC